MEHNRLPDASPFSLSGPLSVEELERLYGEVVLKQDFYGDAYGSDWSPAPYEAIAKMVAEVVAPQKHVDVGCGKGFLVLAMRKLNISSFGIDFSEALVQQAPHEIKSYVHVARTEDWVESPFFQGADLITYMEVFEHLPVSVCRFILRTLRNRFDGRLLLTTPSYGVDSRLKSGILATHPAWREDMARNSPFRNIVLENNQPHHGHITLASYRWWSEFFLFNGWVRSDTLERKALSGFGTILEKYHWNLYLLEPLPVDGLTIDTATSNQLGPGWHHVEASDTDASGRWTDGYAQLYINCESVAIGSIIIELTAPDINVVKDFTLTVVIERQVQSPALELQWIPHSISFPAQIDRRRPKMRLELPLLEATERNASHPGYENFRLTLISPWFSPQDYHLSTDPRRLGLFVHKIIVDPARRSPAGTASPPPCLSA